MSTAKRYLVTAFAFAIFMIVFTTFAPRAVHAITATLVQVVNTSANPVPTVESGTQFQAAVCFTSIGGVAQQVSQCASGSDTFIVPTTTSSGATVKRLVIENYSGTCSNFNNPTLQILAVRLYGPFAPDNVNHGLVNMTNYAPTAQRYSYVNDPAATPPYSGIAETDYTFGQTTHWAFNPGDTVHIDLYAFSTGRPGEVIDEYCAGRAVGYLITQ